MNINRRSIRRYEYQGRGMMRIVLGEKVKRIGDSAFSECENLEDVVFPEGLEHIGCYVFQESPKIKVLNLPSSLVDIKESAFFIGTDGLLERIDVSPDNPKYCSVDGILFTKDMKTLVQFPQNKDCDSYVVPDTVEAIADNAFGYATKLKRIALPKSLRKIGSGAFEWCESLDRIEIPDSVEGIPSYAFFCCYSLEDVRLPRRLGYLGFESFANCPMIKEFDIPPGFDQLDYAILGGCESLERVTIPEGIVDINNSAFIDCPRLRNVRLPSTVIALWEKAFCRCSSLEEINIPPEVYHVTDDVFQGCDSLKRIYIEGNLESRYWVPEGAEVILGSPPSRSGKN